MNKNAVICAIEHALRNEGCNEVTIGHLYSDVKMTRCNMEVSFDEFMAVLKELVRDGLFEFFEDSSTVSESSLIARSQMHPSVPYGGAIRL